MFDTRKALKDRGFNAFTSSNLHVESGQDGNKTLLLGEYL